MKPMSEEFYRTLFEQASDGIVITDGEGRGVDSNDRFAHLLGMRADEPFFTTKSAGEGSGLGLAVTLGVVREHQGALRAVSEPGKGAVFTVYLPAHEWASPEAVEDLMALPRARGNASCSSTTSAHCAGRRSSCSRTSATR